MSAPSERRVSTTSSSVVGPMSDRLHLRLQATGSASASSRWRRILSSGSSLLNTRMPRSVRRAVLEEEVLDQVRPEAAAWARTRARGGPGRTAGSASPSRGCAPRRRRARSASGRPWGTCRVGSRETRRSLGPSCVSLARRGRLAGRQVGRGEERQVCSVKLFLTMRSSY